MGLANFFSAASPHSRFFDAFSAPCAEPVGLLRVVMLLLCVAVLHTSASLTINENASPDVPLDLNVRLYVFKHHCMQGSACLRRHTALHSVSVRSMCARAGRT